MNKTKKLYILLGVLVVACAATFLVTRMEEKKEQIKISGDAVLEIPADSVTKLAWKNEDAELSFGKNDDGSWTYEGDEAFPVSTDKIGEMLSIFEDFRAAFTIDEVENYAQYGLDDPMCTIDIDTGDASYEMLLGDFSTMDEQRYISIGDGKAYLAQSDPYDEFGAVLSDMIDHDVTPSVSSAIGINFSGNENYGIFYEEESPATYCDEDLYFVNDNGETLPLDTAKVKDYLSAVGNLELIDFVSYNVTDEELKSFGLDDPELMITINYTEEDPFGDENTESFLLNISRDPEELKAIAEAEAAEEAIKAEAGAAGEDGSGDEGEEGAVEGTADNESSDSSGDEEAEEEVITAYARVGSSQIVYQITGDEYTQLMAASYDDLRHAEIFTGSWDIVTGLDIDMENTTYSITSEADDDELTYYYLEKAVDVSGIEDALGAISASSFTDEKPSDKKEIELKLYLDNENFPEVDLAFYRYNGTDCLAEADGKPVSLVPRSSVVALIEAVNAIVLGD